GWGRNDSGQATVPAGLSNVVGIAAGLYHSLALRSDGTVAAWGNNTFGQATVPAGLDNVVAIDAGHDHSLALQGDGTVVAWGNNTVGQATVPAGLGNVVAVAAGNGHSLALPQAAASLSVRSLPSVVVGVGCLGDVLRVQVKDVYGHPVSGAVVRFDAPV